VRSLARRHVRGAGAVVGVFVCGLALMTVVPTAVAGQGSRTTGRGTSPGNNRSTSPSNSGTEVRVVNRDQVRAELSRKTKADMDRTRNGRQLPTEQVVDLYGIDSQNQVIPLQARWGSSANVVYYRQDPDQQWRRVNPHNDVSPYTLVMGETGSPKSAPERAGETTNPLPVPEPRPPLARGPGKASSQRVNAFLDPEGGYQVINPVNGSLASAVKRLLARQGELDLTDANLTTWRAGLGPHGVPVLRQRDPYTNALGRWTYPVKELQQAGHERLYRESLAVLDWALHPPVAHALRTVFLFLNRHLERPFGADELAAAGVLNRQLLPLTLEQLAGRGLIEETEPGRYQARLA